MSTVLRIGKFRFFFYAGDKDEPPHIHIEHDNNTAKFWLDPVRYCKSYGFNRNEINKISKLVRNNQEYLINEWNEYFKD
jgi:hypothetical protein